MTTIVLWILIASTGRGVTVVDRFPTSQACEEVRRAINETRGGSFYGYCYRAEVIR